MGLFGIVVASIVNSARPALPLFYQYHTMLYYTGLQQWIQDALATRTQGAAAALRRASTGGAKQEL